MRAAGRQAEGSSGELHGPTPSATGFGLAGKVAVVTGGAGAIGAATCVALAREGAQVVVADIDEERTQATAESVGEVGGRAVPLVLDLTQADAVDAMMGRAVQELGGVDILVNALGDHLRAGGPHEHSSEAAWQGLYEVNLLHVFRTCRAAIPLMRERGWGRIVNFSSVEGIRAAPALAVYASFKAAVDSFTKSLAVDIARYGICANAIAVDKTRAYQTGHYELPAAYEHLVDTWIPAGRYAEPEEVARIALFLASNLSSWIVGQTIPADGGTLAAGGWYRTPARWTNQPLLVQYFDEGPEENERRPPSLR